MTSTLVRHLSPEEEELARKRAELATLESELVRHELALATLRAELFLTERRYLRVVGALYADLDQIEAEIAETILRTSPNSTAAREHATHAREQAQRSSDATNGVADESERPRPTESVKQLFRAAAKLFHPDLASDPAERERRTTFMAAANSAYEAGDAVRLQALIDEWQAHETPVPALDIGAELVRLIRSIASVRARLEAMRRDIEQLQGSQTADLQRRIDEARAEGRDLLEEMAAEVREQIATARARLTDLRQTASKA
jgi:hypothetical protein